MIVKLVEVIKQIWFIIINKLGRQTYIRAKECEKYRSNFAILKKWMLLKYEGIDIEDYLINNHLLNIAIYGMGDIGKILYRELAESSVNIRYVIDRNAMWVYSDVDIYTLSNSIDYPQVDVIIITVMMNDRDLKEEINQLTKANVISLEEIISGLAE